MPKFVIDNKKIDLTYDEWALYNKIVKSYTTTTSKGEDLFVDLFETNEDGIMTILKPPSRRQTSFEIFFFLMSVFQSQHMRVLYERVDDICRQMKDKIQEIDSKKGSHNGSKE